MMLSNTFPPAIKYLKYICFYIYLERVDASIEIVNIYIRDIDSNYRPKFDCDSPHGVALFIRNRIKRRSDCSYWST